MRRTLPYRAIRESGLDLPDRSAGGACYTFVRASAPHDSLLQHLHALPVSAGAIRLLVALIAEGALEREVKLSNLKLGRACFLHEPEKLGDQVLRKRVGRFVEELEQAKVLQVTAVKVGQGHGPSKYRVILDPGSSTERQEVHEAPKMALVGQPLLQESRPVRSLVPILRPQQKRLAPPHLRPATKPED